MALTEVQITTMSDPDRTNAATQILTADIWQSGKQAEVQTKARATPGWAAEVLRGACGVVDAIAAASITGHRVANWTEYVRSRRWDVRPYDLGIGVENVLACAGCGRYTPILALSGEHVLPKSDPDTIMTQVILPGDGLLEATGGPKLSTLVYLSLNAVRVRTEDAIVITNRSTYINPMSIALDRRNIVAFCYACNTKKGTRPSSARPAAPGGWVPVTR